MPKSWLPVFLGGKSCHLDAQTEKVGFHPHISLAYLQGTPKAREELAEETAAVLGASFVAKELTVWETDLEDFTCKSWKQVATFKLEGKKPVSFWRLFRRVSDCLSPLGLGQFRGHQLILIRSAQLCFPLSWLYFLHLWRGKALQLLPRLSSCGSVSAQCSASGAASSSTVHPVSSWQRLFSLLNSVQTYLNLVT